MAGFNLGDIFATLKLNTDSLKDGMSDVQNMGDKTKTLGSKIQTGLNQAAAGLAVVGAGLTVYAKKATDYTMDLVSSSKALGTTIGVSTEQASRLVAAVGRMGISAQDATQMFGIFSKQIVAATTNSTANQLAAQKLAIQIDQTKASIKATTDEITKNGDATGSLHLKLMDLNNTLATQQNAQKASTDSFAKLGISTTDASGKQKDFTTILGEVADKFKDMPNGVDKTTIAMDLFGRSGKDMIKTLNLGSDGIADLEKKADELGLTLNAKTITSIAALVKSQKDLKEQSDAMKIAVGTLTAPVLTAYNTWLNNVLKTIMNINPQMKTMTANVLAFGGPVASGASATAGFLGNLSSIGPKLGQFLLKLGLWGAVIAAVALALYELQKNFGIFDDLGGKIVAVWQHFNDLYGITTILTQFWQQVMWPAIMAIWAAIQQNLWPAVEQLWDALVRLYNALEPGLTDVLKVLAVLLGAVLLGAVWLILAGLNVLIQVFSMLVSAISNVINWVANLIGWFGNLVGVVWNTIKTIASIFWNLPQAFMDVVGVLWSIAAGLGGLILKALGNLGGTLYNAGKDLLNGFINGIKDKADDVFNAVKNIGSQAVSKLKGVLKIFSPSKVFHQLGGFLGQGFAEGIVSTVGQVSDAIDTLASPAMALANNGIPVTAGTGQFLNGSQLNNNDNSSNSKTVIAKTEINGDINIGSKSDADYFLNRLDRNNQLEGMGLSPA